MTSSRRTPPGPPATREPSRVSATPANRPTAPPTSRIALEALEARDVPSVSVRLDYTYDTSGYFDATRRAAMDRAVAQIAPRLQDGLAAVAPTGINSWQVQFFNPATNGTVTLNNPTLRQDEIVVYVGASKLSGGELGLTTSGGYSATGTRNWLDAVKSRGQAGALLSPKADYATWGAMITFDNRANWNFGEGEPAANQYDFNTVALHELMHVFGFGLGEPAFTRHIVGGAFAGPNVVAANGGVGVPIEGSPPDHFAQGTRWQGQEDPMQPVLAQGTRRRLTPLDFAALADIGWEVSGLAQNPATATASVAPQSSPLVAAPAAMTTISAAPLSGRVVVGGANAAIVYDAAGQPVRSVQPFGANFAGGVRALLADVTGDGVKDLLAASGPGMAGTVNLYDGVTGGLLAWVQPFEASFTGGVNLAAGDLNGDGKAELVVTPDQSGGPVVALFDGASLAQGRAKQLNRFWGLNDPAFRGGLRPAVGDLNGDGTPDIVLAAGYGGGPRVAVVDGRVAASGGLPVSIAPDFFAFEPGLRNGVFVTVADVNGDGVNDLVAGAGPGGGPRVTAFSGKALLAGVRTPVANFFAGDTGSRTGVRVAAADVDADGRPDLIASSGAQALVYAAKGLTGVAPPAWLTVTAPGAPAAGLHVG